jgi:hypothetical protein
LTGTEGAVIESTETKLDANQKFLADGENIGIVREFWEFMKANKMWWMGPIIMVALLLLGLVVLGSSSAAAPFIYTLF